MRDLIELIVGEWKLNMMKSRLSQGYRKIGDDLYAFRACSFTR